MQIAYFCLEKLSNCHAKRKWLLQRGSNVSHPHWAYPQCPPRSSEYQRIRKNSHTGVSTHFTPPHAQVVNENIQETSNAHSNWYALKATYGREKVAYDYLVSKGVTAFCPMQKTVKIVQGKRKIVEQSRLPNIFFAFGTETEIKSYVYDNVHLPFLRFYYRHLHKGAHIEREPLIVPQRQIDTFKCGR